MTTEFLTLGFAGVDWIEHYLVHGPGDVQGEPIDLDDEFAAFVVKAYRVDPKTGARRVRRAFLSRSKGRSKSELGGMLDCFEGLGPCRFEHWAEDGEVSDWGYEYEPGEPVGKPLGYVEILNVATEESQAGNTYDNAHYMLHPETCSPELLSDYGRIDVGLTRINLPNRRGFIEPVTAANESKDGAKSTFIVADETHLWTPPAAGVFKLGKMHQTMVRNLLKRKAASGWMLETSTMYAEGERSVAEGTHAYARLRRGDGRLLFDHRQASDEWDPVKRSERVKALREAYGPAAAWMDLGAIADYWDDPQATEAEFRRFWLNQPVPLVETSTAFFGDDAWESCKTKKKPPYNAPTFSVARSVDQAWTSIGYSEQTPRGAWHLAPVDRRRGSHWLPGKVAELHEKFPESRWVIATTGPASALIDGVELIVGEERVVRANSADLCDASADVYDRVLERRVEHRSYPELDDAVADAQRRVVGDRWAIGRKNSDVSMLEAVTLALWGANQPEEPDVPLFAAFV